MKEAINFLPQKPEKKAETQREKMIRLGSLVILAVFLIFNLVLFGFYFLERKNTSDHLAAISRQETVITNLSSTENLYRQLKQKLSFLTAIWIEPQRVNDSLVFVNGFMGAEANLEKMDFNQDGSVSLNLSSPSSSGLESFLNKGRAAEQEGKIWELKIDSVNKTIAGKDTAYKFILTFKFNKK